MNPIIKRGIERAAKAAWIAGREERARHIHALRTAAREHREDLEERTRAADERYQREMLRAQAAILNLFLGRR